MRPTYGKIAYVSHLYGRTLPKLLCISIMIGSCLNATLAAVRVSESPPVSKAKIKKPSYR